MRGICFLPLLLLAACDSSDEKTATAPPPAVPAGLDAPPPPPSQSELDAKARAAMSTTVLDPGSAEYRGIRAGSGGSVCGEVNAKGDDGKPQGFRPFVVSPEGVPVLSSAAEIRWDEPSDLYPDFYIRYCAPPEELPSLAARMAKRTESTLPPDAASGNAIGIEEVPPLPLPPPEPPPVIAEAPPPPAPKPTRVPARPTNPNDESFFNAVMRPAEEK